MSLSIDELEFFTAYERMRAKDCDALLPATDTLYMARPAASPIMGDTSTRKDDEPKAVEAAGRTISPTNYDCGSVKSEQKGLDSVFGRYIFSPDQQGEALIAVAAVANFPMGVASTCKDEEHAQNGQSKTNGDQPALIKTTSPTKFTRIEFPRLTLKQLRVA